MLYLITFLHQTTTVGLVQVFRFKLYLITFLHQTTTRKWQGFPFDWLYLITFLHQTTTGSQGRRYGIKLYLITFLHQTTTIVHLTIRQHCCILLHFYIKPQPTAFFLLFCFVVSYYISTSNHN